MRTFSWVQSLKLPDGGKNPYKNSMPRLANSTTRRLGRNTLRTVVPMREVIFLSGGRGPHGTARFLRIDSVNRPRVALHYRRVVGHKPEASRLFFVSAD